MSRLTPSTGSLFADAAKQLEMMRPRYDALKRLITKLDNELSPAGFRIIEPVVTANERPDLTLDAINNAIDAIVTEVQRALPHYTYTHRAELLSFKADAADPTRGFRP